MDKAVMLSIRPKWAEKIANGEKTIEVRKTRPKLATPFKAYLYVTAGNLSYRCPNGMICHNSGGRIIIGEFLCKKIDRIVRVGYMGGMAPPSYFVEALNSLSGILPIKSLLNASCLTLRDLEAYFSGGCGYGWHISNLKIYDAPRELSEFQRATDPCDSCHAEYTWECTGCKKLSGDIKRPPQSWCYVEAMKDE